MSLPVVAPAEKMAVLIASSVVAVALAYMGVHTILAKRRRVVWWLGRFLATYAVVWFARVLMGFMGLRGWWTTYVALVIAVPFFPHRSLYPKRKRSMPKDVREAVKRRHIQVYKHYDSDKVCIDHIYPFSKGGDHTMDNLRVIAKAQNLKKRDNDPELVDWIRADFVALKAFILGFSRRSLN